MKLTLERIKEMRRELLKRDKPGPSLSFEEALSLLDSARALARLEGKAEAIEADALEDGQWEVTLLVNNEPTVPEIAPTLAAAIHQALDGAEVRE